MISLPQSLEKKEMEMQTLTAITLGEVDAHIRLLMMISDNDQNDDDGQVLS